MMHLILLQAEWIRQEWLRYLQLGPGDEVSILPLAKSSEPLESLLAHLQAAGAPSVETVAVRDQVKAAAYTAREKYIKFIADWPTRYRRGDKSFKELLAHQGWLSLWWLSRMRMKDVEGSPTFTLLFQLELLSIAFQQRRFTWLHLFSEDALFRDLVSQWGQPRDVGVTLYPQHPSSAETRFPIMVHLLSRFKFAINVGASVLLVKLLWPLMRPPSRREGEEETILFTYLGDTLLPSSSGLQDRHYADLPAYLEEHTPLRPLYASPVYGHLRSFLRQIRQVLAQRKRLILLESYLTIGDALKALLDWRVPARYLRDDLLDERFRATFEYDGLNIHGLVRREMLTSYVGPGIMDCLLLAKAFQRLARKRSPRYVVSFLEFYPHALALYAGVKRGEPSVTTVAYQHAGVTRMKLWYCSHPSEMATVESQASWGMEAMPTPDIFLCQGSLGKSVVMESGYPQDRCFLTGSPRYDQLGGHAPRAEDAAEERASLGIPAGKRVILVSTPYSLEEASYLVRMVGEACSADDDWFVLFKPHPVDSAERVSAEAARYLDPHRHVVLNDPVQRLIQLSDVVVTTYSTTADEAVALDRPVIIVQRDSGFSMATIWEIEAAPTGTDAQELQSCLETLFQRPRSFDRYREKWPELIEGTFFKLDGCAKERVTQVLMAAPAPGRPHERGGVKAAGRL